MTSVKSVPESLAMRHRRVRAAFLCQGTSFDAWCRQNGVHPQNAHKAMTGRWSGPKAAQLVDRILSASGVRD